MNKSWFDFNRKQERNIYNMRLLKRLNKEYKKHPMQSTFSEYTEEEQINVGMKRRETLMKNIDFDGKRVLEIGGGAGYTSWAISQSSVEYVVCTDIYENEQWAKLKNEKLQFKKVDLSIYNPFKENQFDIIVSFVAWEHIKHPYEVLQQAAKVLKENGVMYIFANLYRAPNASHLYRTIYFPWPHLLFDESIVKKYARKHGVENWFIDAFYDVNKLTYAQYKEYFQMLHLEIFNENKSIIPLDVDFYKRFEDKLGLYPISDLELSFFEVYLRKKASVPLTKKIIAYKPTVVGPDENYKKGDSVQLSICAEGIDLEYAWYIYCDNQRIDTIWYTSSPTTTYTFLQDGEYYMLCFVRDKSGQKVSYKTNKVRVIE